MVVVSNSSWKVDWLLMAADGREIPLPLRPGRSLTVGRDLTSDVSLLDAGISRHHALLSLERPDPASADPDLAEATPELWVEDLHSQNGTFVNTRQIQHSRLQEGDVVTFGRLQLTVFVRQRRSSRASGLPGSLPSRDLTRLLEISRQMNSSRDPTTSLQIALDALVSALHAEHAALLLWDAHRTELRPVVSSPHEGFHELESLVSATTGQTVLEGRRDAPLLASRGGGGAVTGEAGEPPRVTAPLFAAEQPVGMVYVDRPRRAPAFTRTESRFLAAFSWIVETVVESAEDVPHAEAVDRRGW